MTSNRLILAISKGIFALDDRYVAAHIPVVAKILSGEILSESDNPNKKKVKVGAYAIHQASYKSQKFSKFDEAPQGSIAVIPVQGTIMKNDYCGAAGTATIAKYVKEADNHPNISAIILHIDSPGGAVDGTGEFSDLVSQTAKPVVAFVDGLSASAGYWISSSANHIMASHETVEVGSIGTMITIYDNAEALKSYGYAKHTIRADKSKDKNEDYYQVLKSNYEPIIKNLLNPTNEIFLKAIKKNREGKIDLSKEDVLTGKVYLAQDALKHGLIDSIGNFDAAVATANELSLQQNQQTLIQMKKVSFKASLTALAAFFGLAKAEGSENVEGEVSAEQWEKLNSTVEENTTLKTQLADRDKTIGENATKVTGLEAQVNTLTSEVTSWKAKYAEVAAGVSTTTEGAGKENQNEKPILDYTPILPKD